MHSSNKGCVMNNVLKSVFLFIALIVTSLSEPLTYDSAKAGWGADEQSCTSPWYWQANQCMPDDFGADVIVYGTQGFDVDFYNLYILPMYSASELSNVSYLPPVADVEGRGRELNRRKQIHDCVARELAAGMRADIPGLSTQLEVTFEYQGVRARFDIVQSVGGIPTGVTEVKTVLDFEGASEDLLVRNQPIVAEGIRNGGAVPYGTNASLAGFITGQPIGRSIPFSVATVHIANECKNP